MNSVFCFFRIGFLILVISFIALSCSHTAPKSKPQPAICMIDGIRVFKEARDDSGVVSKLGLGTNVLVFPDSSSFSVHDTIHLFKKIQIVGDSTRGGWVRADYLALNCRYAAVIAYHSEIYADDLAPVDTISYMAFIAAKPSHIAGYVRIYKVRHETDKMVTGLIPVGRITIDTTAAEFARAYEIKAQSREGRRLLFSTADTLSRQTDFFKKEFRHELDSINAQEVPKEIVEK